jgi:hypothetical protein
VRAPRAELALLQGRLEDARAEAKAGLALLNATDAFWEREQLGYLLWRADGRCHPFQACGDSNGPRHLQEQR